MDQVIPQGLNYADIKPEIIFNEVKLIRMIPLQNIIGSRPNDVVRFQLQGNTFIDPYSLYARIEVEVDTDDMPDSTLTHGFTASCVDGSAQSFIHRLVIRSSGTEIERIEQYDVVARMIEDMLYSHEQAQIHSHEGFNSQLVHGKYIDAATAGEQAGMTGAQGLFGASGVGNTRRVGFDPTFYHVGGSVKAELDSNIDAAISLPSDIVNGVPVTMGAAGMPISRRTMTFCIPIYSGVLGILMPDKKLLPVSLLPLDIEFTLNPHALYRTGFEESKGSRGYSIKTFDLYAHSIMFEQEIHRSLESVVASSGIFIHYNTFYHSPVTVNSTTAVQQTVPINVQFKSINAIHFVCLYSGFETDQSRRKLHFVSHGLNHLQIRNGTFLIPSEPIKGNMRQTGVAVGSHRQFLIETYKGWNKMHNPETDGAITGYSYTIDTAQPQACASLADTNTAAQLYSKLAAVTRDAVNVGKCQYAISLEGEELGQDKTTMSGKVGMFPFDINMQGLKQVNTPSYVYTFVRSDMVIYVRPDLIVSVLGIGFTPGAIEASKERLRSRIIRGVPLDIPYEPDDDPHAMQTRLSTKLPLHTRFGRLRQSKKKYPSRRNIFMHNNPSYRPMTAQQFFNAPLNEVNQYSQTTAANMALNGAHHAQVLADPTQLNGLNAQWLPPVPLQSSMFDPSKFNRETVARIAGHLQQMFSKMGNLDQVISDKIQRALARSRELIGDHTISEDDITRIVRRSEQHQNEQDDEQLRHVLPYLFLPEGEQEGDESGLGEELSQSQIEHSGVVDRSFLTAQRQMGVASSQGDMGQSSLFDDDDY